MRICPGCSGYVGFRFHDSRVDDDARRELYALAGETYDPGPEKTEAYCVGIGCQMKAVGVGEDDSLAYQSFLDANAFDMARLIVKSVGPEAGTRIMLSAARFRL